MQGSFFYGRKKTRRPVKASGLGGVEVSGHVPDAFGLHAAFGRRYRNTPIGTAIASTARGAHKACSALVRTAILTVMAPSWAKAIATIDAARNGMNMGRSFVCRRIKKPR